MSIEEEKLIIDSAMSDEDIEEFLVTISQEQIKKVIIKNDDISSSIIQAIWCSKKDVEVESEFLKPFFENIVVGENS